MNRTVYNHSNGFTLDFKGNALIASDDDGKTVSLPIEPLALMELGNALLVLAAEEVEKFTSERAGAVMGFDLVDELFALRGKPQAEAFRAITTSSTPCQNWRISTVLPVALLAQS